MAKDKEPRDTSIHEVDVKSPRVLDRKHDLEVTRRNDAAIQQLTQADNKKAKVIDDE